MKLQAESVRKVKEEDPELLLLEGDILATREDVEEDLAECEKTLAALDPSFQVSLPTSV